MKRKLRYNTLTNPLLEVASSFKASSRLLSERIQAKVVPYHLLLECSGPAPNVTKHDCIRQLEVSLTDIGKIFKCIFTLSAMTVALVSEKDYPYSREESYKSYNR